MFNPFLKFEPRYIEVFRKMEDRYIVIQIYKDAYDHFSSDGKEYLLCSQYSDLSRANIHMSALTNDRFAAVMDLEDEKDRATVLDLLKVDSNYVVYVTVINKIEEVQKRLNAKYTGNMRRYIMNNTDWKIGSDKTIYPKLDLAFGELYVVLKYNNQQIRVKLADIEKA